MRKRVIASFIILFTLITAIFAGSSLQIKAADTTKKNILIINSYQSGFEWTDDQTNGILSTLSTMDMNYDVSIEYLDWKRYSSESNLTNTYNSMKFKYSGQPIDVIITTDDAAFTFAAKYRSKLFSNAPIVFSGINADGLPALAQNIDNYTGVFESLEPGATIQAALHINPSIQTIYLINDDTESGVSTAKICTEAAKKLNSNLNVKPLDNMAADDIINYVSHIDKDSMVLLTSYFVDINGNPVNHSQFCEQLSEASPVPVYHLFDFGLGHGILGGKLINGEVQGKEAGSLAIRVLQGEPASTTPIICNTPCTFTFDYNLLKKYSINLSDLPAGSQIINKPFSFIETYRTLVYSVLVIFFLLISFAVILLFYIKKIKIMQLKLTASHEELTLLYEELTASEEKLRNQLDEVNEGREQLQRYSDQLQHIAYHDTLTGLYNRLYLKEEIAKELMESSNNSAILFIDLDNFKFVNDTLGHNIGDELLKSISSRLLMIASKNNVLIRLGGDEFIFYLYNIEDSNYAEEFAKRIITTFHYPFNINENYIAVTVSIGVALFPENGTDIDTLLKNADMAMYKAKSQGKNGYFFFNHIIQEELLSRVHIESNFRKALSQNEFQLYYQPQVNVISNKIDGFEALIRWNSPELGMLPPLKFISVAEETGFITTLGQWILKTACQYVKELNEQKHTAYKISVNISVIQMLQDNFVNVVKQVLNKTGLQPELLELEITESIILESRELVIEKLKELRSFGIRIALDDFGTGYSSLSYLRNIPITTLKIDKLFIDDISNDTKNTDITDTIIDLGHKLNLTIVAEGVENDIQLQYLKENRCDKIQGYLFSKPLPVGDLENLLTVFEGKNKTIES